MAKSVTSRCTSPNGTTADASSISRFATLQIGFGMTVRFSNGEEIMAYFGSRASQEAAKVQLLE